MQPLIARCMRIRMMETYSLPNLLAGVVGPHTTSACSSGAACMLYMVAPCALRALLCNLCGPVTLQPFYYQHAAVSMYIRIYMLS